jgi:CRISPR/Cas system-associated endonuclease/helicase Cas3
VQSAAVLADYFARNFGREHIEHLSTALTPIDRETTLERVTKRLTDKDAASDTDWTLIATSCVEAGMDFSFRTGFRELGSLVSLLQASGRINRENKFDNAAMWTFKIAEDGFLKSHPGIKDAATILEKYIKEGIEIKPELSTQSRQDELKQHGYSSKVFEDLVKREKQQSFPLVESGFKVIDTNTRLVIANEATIETIKRHEKIDWQTLQKNSVQIWKYKIDELHLPEIMNEIYEWSFAYDDFLGYMAGVIAIKKFESGTGEGTIV